jgi:two-component system phosphate regulon sensor histidine kinase PhoR
VIVLARNKREVFLAVLLLLVAGGLAFGLTRVDPARQPVNMRIVALGVLALAALMTLWLHRRGIGRTVRQVCSQIERINEEESGGRILVDRHDGDEYDVPLNRCLISLTQQMEELKESNRTLQIRSRLVDDERRRVESVLRLVSDGVLVTNRFDELIFANQFAEQLMGFQLENVMRKNIDEIFTDGALVRMLRETRTHGLHQPKRVVEHTVDAQNAPHTLSILLHCVMGQEDQPVGVVAVLQDITKDKEIERAKTDFVSNVSHELKTPLASIKAYVEMLLDEEIRDEKSRREFYDIIASETERLNRMIDRILNISRIQSGGVRVVREPVSMTAVVKQVSDIVVPQARAKQIDIRQELPPVYYQVEADYDLLCQAILNLMTNAVKYTPEGGEIFIRVSVDERRQRAMIEVGDNGIGIPADELPKIFEKFYRVRANTKMATGTGLGLPLVKYIVETVHGSKLSVTSQPGEGTTFSFELPLVA